MPPKKRALEDSSAPVAESKSGSTSTTAKVNKKEKKSILIEACKSWGAFKTRASKLETAWRSMGYDVTINGTKPRKGVSSKNFIANKLN